MLNFAGGIVDASFIGVMIMLKFIHSSRHLTLTLLMSALLTVPAWALPNGNWQGSIQVQGQKLAVEVKLNHDDHGKWSGSIDIPAQKAKDLPLKDIVFEKDHLHFVIDGVPGEPTFDGVLNADESVFKGQFTQAGQQMAFELERLTENQKTQAAEQEKLLLEKLRNQIENMRKEFKTPGLAVAIVKEDRVLLAEGFGLRSLETKQKVDAETVFAIGSCTKAFTATLLGLLVDQGKLNWDTPIQDYLPAFRLKETFASEHITTRDLLTHRSGLPRHDLAWYGSSLSREELLVGLKFLQPSADFRTQFQYQNLMYMSAGAVAEKITGESWESLIQARLFNPLGMTHSNTTLKGIQSDPNHALPHRKKGQELKSIPFRSLGGVAPAGAINASVQDMAQWLRFNLNQGRVGKQSLISEAVFGELLSPQIVMQGRSGQAEIPYTLYGLGWMIQPYRGLQMVHHGGNIDGFTALVSLIPEKKLGIVVLSNKDGDPLPNLLNYVLSDLLMDLEPIDWSGRFKQVLDQVEKLKKTQDLRNRVKNTRPSHDLSAYAGTYSHPAYGEVNLSKIGNVLHFQLHDFKGELQHWHYDTFVVHQPDSILDGLWLHFNTNQEGDLQTLQIKLEPMTEAIVFKRKAPVQMQNQEYLKRYLGLYDVAGRKLKILLKGTVLFAVTEGQPPYELEPIKSNLFHLKGLEGYSVRFDFKGDKLEKAVFIQPNGSFEGKPVKEAM
jgi:CubicO group peptidase (beta-lactamase class C family)